MRMSATLASTVIASLVPRLDFALCARQVLLLQRMDCAVALRLSHFRQLLELALLLYLALLENIIMVQTHVYPARLIVRVVSQIDTTSLESVRLV